MRTLPTQYKQLFEETKSLLLTKYSPYHANKVQGYENSDLVYPRISLPIIFRNSQYNQKLNWAKKALSIYKQNLTVDAFRNDNLGFTRLYYDSNANKAVDSCIEKSLFAGVSFLWVIKDDSAYKSKLLVRGAHTTAIVKDGNNVKFAITRVNTENYADSEYFVYTPEYFYKIKSTGEIIERASSEGIDILVFSVDAEYGSSSIGKSIFSTEFFTAQKNASVAQNLLQQGTLLTLANKNILIAEGMDPTVYDGELESERPSLEEKQDTSQITTIYNPNSSGSLKLEALEEVSVESVKELIRENAKIAGSEVFLSPESFGYAEELKPDTRFPERIKELRKQYENVISSLGKILMKNYLGLKVEEPSWGELVVKFYDSTNIEKIGQIGDALYKLNDLGVDISGITDSLIGRELKPEKMKIALPTRATVVSVEAESIEDTLKREQEFLEKLTILTENTATNNTISGVANV